MSHTAGRIPGSAAKRAAAPPAAVRPRLVPPSQQAAMRQVLQLRATRGCPLPPSEQAAIHHVLQLRADPQARALRPSEEAAMWDVLQRRAEEEQAAAPSRPHRSGLPEPLKAGVEALSGLAMDDVRVHRNSSEPARLGALAYAHGSDIHLGPGQEEHLPHEAWHVVQQKQGRVRATLQLMSGLPVNDEAALEREADVMGGRALAANRSASRPLPILQRAPAGGESAVVQRLIKVGSQTRTPEAWQNELDPDASDEPRGIALREALAALDGQEFATNEEFIRAVAAATAEREPLHQAAVARWAEVERQPEVGGPQPQQQAQVRAPSPFGPYRSVSPSSAHHDLKHIVRMAPSAAAKKYGFSFVDKGIEAADVRDINRYMNHILQGLPPPPPVAVVSGPATHDGAKDGMIQFTLHGRTYSTHADTPQLFPVAGAGIVSGKGVKQMLAALKAMEKEIGPIGVATYYAITHEDGKPWKQAGRELQRDVQVEFDKYRK